MTSVRRVEPILTRCFCLIVGISLAFQMDRLLRSFPSIVRRSWYESEYFPFFAACAVLLVLCVLRPTSPRDHAWNGLLMTGPPYAWYATAVIQSWLQASGNTDTAVHVKALATGVTLALSGAAVGAVSCFVIGLAGRRLDRKPG